jgi:hypothetical protein
MPDRIRQHVLLNNQPVVAVGHSKDFCNDRSFDQFLATIRQNKQVVLQRVSEFIEWKVNNDAREGSGL